MREPRAHEAHGLGDGIDHEHQCSQRDREGAAADAGCCWLGREIVRGALLAAAEYPIELILVGREEDVRREISEAGARRPSWSGEAVASIGPPNEWKCKARRMFRHPTRPSPS